MPENLKQFVKRVRQAMKAELKAELLAEATPEELLKVLTLEQRVKGMSAEQLRQALKLAEQVESDPNPAPPDQN